MASMESSLLFRLERGPGIALQAMQEKKALSSRGRGRLRGFLELRRPWGFSPEARRGSQGASRAAPGKSNVAFELRGRVGDYSRVTAGQNRPHLGLCPGPKVPLQGLQGSPGCNPDSPGESGLILRRSKGLHSPLQSRRVSLGAH